jgi:hypothetical protein
VAIALVHNGVLSISLIILALARHKQLMGEAYAIYVVLAKPPQLRCSVLVGVAKLVPIITIADRVAIR